ncbi:MAG: hypothetical protein E7317_10665 [Clostridiales bacterium]|nr:hypothetical protein [Clostridiales bacterium]
MSDMIPASRAVGEVRMMATQFAELYYQFVRELREALGDEGAMRVAQKALYARASERARAMVTSAASEGLERTPENIPRTSDVPYLGWDASLGRDHCPYGAAWIKRINAEPWFRPYARLYCDVTDTTIAEEFTGRFSHRLIKNVVLGDDTCARTYFEDAAVKAGRRTYAPGEDA